jgi:hypothetical protein
MRAPAKKAKPEKKGRSGQETGHQTHSGSRQQEDEKARRWWTPVE